MHDVIIALGSNVGDRLQFLIRAVDELNTLGTVVSVAGLYESSAYGYKDQPSFLNSAVYLKTQLELDDLLDNLQAIEKKTGRSKRIRWGPREIDLDVIFYNNMTIDSERLTIPHPDFHNRLFVLKPLAELIPDYISPVHRKSITELLNECQDTTKINFISSNWCSNGKKI